MRLEGAKESSSAAPDKRVRAALEPAIGSPRPTSLAVRRPNLPSVSPGSSAELRRQESGCRIRLAGGSRTRARAFLHLPKRGGLSQAALMWAPATYRVCLTQLRVAPADMGLRRRERERGDPSGASLDSEAGPRQRASFEDGAAPATRVPRSSGTRRATSGPRRPPRPGARVRARRRTQSRPRGRQPRCRRDPSAG
jgi:hypothetical protein